MQFCNNAKRHQKITQFSTIDYLWQYVIQDSISRLQLAYTLWNCAKRAIAVFDRRLTFHSRLFWTFLWDARMSEKNAIRNA